jgi:hypothetical protein
MWKNGKIKYEKGFSDMLERELLTAGQYTQKEIQKEQELKRLFPGGFIRMGCGSPGPEWRFIDPMPHDKTYEIEGKFYGTDFSSFLPLKESSGGYVGRHSDIDFFEMKNEEDFEHILEKNGIELSNNSLLRWFALRKYSSFRYPTLNLGKIEMNERQKISHELYKPKRIAEFIGIPFAASSTELIMVPKKYTSMHVVMRGSGGASVRQLDFPEKELEKYPIVEFDVKLKDNPWAAY